DQRDARNPRSQAARTGGVATEADHHARAPFAQHRSGGAHRAKHLERRTQQRGHTLATQAADRDRVDPDAVLRDQPGFHAALGAEPGHRHATIEQLARDREAREDVSTGTAGEDHHRTHGGVGYRSAHPSLPITGSTRWRSRLVPRVTLFTTAGLEVGCDGNGWLVDGVPADGCAASPRRRATWRCARSSSYDTRSSSPIAAHVISTLEPPDEISGRVRPLVGSSPRL